MKIQYSKKNTLISSTKTGRDIHFQPFENQRHISDQLFGVDKVLKSGPGQRITDLRSSVANAF